MATGTTSRSESSSRCPFGRCGRAGSCPAGGVRSGAPRGRGAAWRRRPAAARSAAGDFDEAYHDGEPLFAHRTLDHPPGEGEWVEHGIEVARVDPEDVGQEWAATGREEA